MKLREIGNAQSIIEGSGRTVQSIAAKALKRFL